MTKSERTVREAFDEAACRKVRGEGRYAVGGYGPDNCWRTLAYGCTRADAWNRAAERVREEFQ